MLPEHIKENENSGLNLKKKRLMGAEALGGIG